MKKWIRKLNKKRSNKKKEDDDGEVPTNGQQQGLSTSNEDSFADCILNRLESKGESTVEFLKSSLRYTIKGDAITGKHEKQPKRKSIKLSESIMEAELPHFQAAIRNERLKEWASSFRRTDPRYQILKFFVDVELVGAASTRNFAGSYNTEVQSISPMLKIFTHASIFTVWRPTSKDAMRRMMMGEAVGKGLDIKGKSSKAGKLSGFVPFLQIHEEKHIHEIRTLPKDSTMRIFYANEHLRNEAAKILEEVSEDMFYGYIDSLTELSDPSSHNDQSEAMHKFTNWEMIKTDVTLIDDYGSQAIGYTASSSTRSSCSNHHGTYGLEIAERLFWEAHVCRRNICRKSGGEHDTRRVSEPKFQDMNFDALRSYDVNDIGQAPRPVVCQNSTTDAMCPLELLVAYEENGRVLPVVSDFDCFLLGTRGVKYRESMPIDQIKLIQWCLEGIDKILENDPNSCSWTKEWLEMLKKEKPINKSMPRFGFGDPKSYRIMEHAVERLSEYGGSVRHGAECFNYYFPQEIDSEFLVISDTFDGIPWRYVDVKGLQGLLLEKIRQGFTFPLNPKWILCDEGFYNIYKELLNSNDVNVQKSLKIWYPPSSGIRERIEKIHSKNPNGFTMSHNNEEQQDEFLRQDDERSSMDLALEMLKNHRIRENARRSAQRKLVGFKELISFHNKSCGSGRNGRFININTESITTTTTSQSEQKKLSRNEVFRQSNQDFFDNKLMTAKRDKKVAFEINDRVGSTTT